MKATLSYTLPEENEEFENARKGWNYQNTLYELDQYLRSKLKYEELTETQQIIYQEVRDKLHSFASDNEVSV